MIQPKLISIKHINREVHDFKANAGYILIILEIGKAFVSRGERCFLLDQMECVLLDGAENISILPDTRTGVFSASVVCFKTEEDLSRACDICTKNSYFILHRLAERLFELTGRNDLSEGWEKQLAMGKLLFLLKTIHKEDDSIKQSLRYIHDNYPLSINRETLAADAHMSVSRFSHRFRETYGASPIDYLKDTRLKHAKVLLKKEHTSMQETADAVGFNDVFYFSRQFRKSFGISPSAYAATVPLKVVSLNYQLTGDLQAADICPETGILDVYRSWYTDRNLRRKENLFE
ncbi:MAG: helix-turn-helix transcriptional regulator [Solobacterium sp.]|nr:helix-turn-helix transcriptional regulator [Solobacterium sp.]